MSSTHQISEYPIRYGPNDFNNQFPCCCGSSVFSSQTHSVSLGMMTGLSKEMHLGCI